MKSIRCEHASFIRIKLVLLAQGIFLFSPSLCYLLTQGRYLIEKEYFFHCVIILMIITDIYISDHYPIHNKAVYSIVFLLLTLSRFTLNHEHRITYAFCITENILLIIWLAVIFLQEYAFAAKLICVLFLCANIGLIVLSIFQLNWRNIPMYTGEYYSPNNHLKAVVTSYEETGWKGDVRVEVYSAEQTDIQLLLGAIKTKPIDYVLLYYDEVDFSALSWLDDTKLQLNDNMIFEIQNNEIRSLAPAETLQ